MRTDASSLLRLGRPPARLMVAIIIASTVVFAVPDLGIVTSVWPVIVGLVLFAVGALIMAHPHPDPFPLHLSRLVLALSVALTVLIDVNLPDSGWIGYAGWNFGAANWLFFFLTFRGRVALGWLGFVMMAAITIVWAIWVGRGYLDGVDLVARHAGTLLMGTLFGIMFRRAAARITALQREQIVQAASEVAALTEIREREVQGAQLNLEAREVLERIAAGDYRRADDQRAFELLEASLRDTLRGAGLTSPQLTAAAREARLRGASVILLDDRNETLDATQAAVVQSAALAELATLNTGSITVRLLPPGRELVATIVRNDGQRRRIDIPATADPSTPVITSPSTVRSDPAGPVDRRRTAP